MSFYYTRALAKFMSGDIVLSTQDIRVLIVMTNTTCDSEEDTEFISGFTTLDEMDGANYVRKALANEAVVADLPNDRGEFYADDVVWSQLGAGTRQMAGIVVYKHVTGDGDSIPIAYIDDGGFPLAANGLDFTAQWNLEGILQHANLP